MDLSFLALLSIGSMKNLVDYGRCNLTIVAGLGRGDLVVAIVTTFKVAICFYFAMYRD